MLKSCNSKLPRRKEKTRRLSLRLSKRIWNVKNRFKMKYREKRKKISSRKNPPIITYKVVKFNSLLKLRKQRQNLWKRLDHAKRSHLKSQ
jgi:hypothetical protein